MAALAAVAAEGKDRHAAIARDTILALQSLGFPEEVGRKMVQSALAASPDINNTQELLRKALNSK